VDLYRKRTGIMDGVVYTPFLKSEEMLVPKLHYL
jgi:hypothetical protein